MKIYERIGLFLLVMAVSILFCSCTAEEAEPAPLPEESPAPAYPAADIKLMFYSAEIEGNMTAVVGESMELHVQVISSAEEAHPVEWESSCETSLSIEPGDAPNEATLKVLSTDKSPVMLTLTCGDLKKVFPVYIMPDREGRESVEPGEIRLKFFNTELSEFTLREGETVRLHVEMDGVDDTVFEWKSSDESCLTIERFEDSRDASVTAGQSGDGRFVLSVSCGDVTKDFPVYIVSAE